MFLDQSSPRCQRIASGLQGDLVWTPKPPCGPSLLLEVCGHEEFKHGSQASNCHRDRLQVFLEEFAERRCSQATRCRVMEEVID